MKQLSKLQRIILAIGAMMMVAGAIVYVAVDSLHAIFSFIFLIGACLYTAMQCQQTYSGNNIDIRRLCRPMMVENSYNFLLSSFIKYLQQGLNSYLTFIVNKWIIALLIGALLQMYCVLRISNELEKEAKKL